jgi:hypothetical protein
MGRTNRGWSAVAACAFAWLVCSGCSALIGLDDVPPPDASVGDAEPSEAAAPDGGAGPEGGDATRSDASLNADASTPDAGGQDAAPSLDASTLVDAPPDDVAVADTGSADTAQEADAGDSSPPSDGGTEGGCPSSMPVTCGTSCVDTDRDTKHCGACDHDCLGGPCAGGRCQPVPLAQGRAKPGGMAIDDTSLYWVDQGFDADAGAVLRCPKSGCSANVTTLASGLINAYAVGADANSVYFNDGQSVLKCPLAGCGGAPTTLGSVGFLDVGGIAVDGKNVYWDSDFDSVAQCSISGCGGAPTTIGSGNGVAGIVSNGKDVYWGSLGGSSAATGQVSKVAVGGGTPLPLGSSQFRPYALALDATNVYWANNGDGTIMACALGGCPSPTPIGSEMGYPGAIAVDASGVYWVDSGGSIFRCPIGGCGSNKPTSLASGQGILDAVVLDPANVYWTDNSNGTVMRVAK